MADATIQIKRYPNRRYYARHNSSYVSLQAIEELVQSGRQVEIIDSQSGDDITRTVLTQIIMDRQPEKMQMFPVDMLHFIVRANDLTTDFLQDYFRHSLTYLNYLQRHSSTATNLVRPMHWVKAWLDGIGSAEKQIQQAASVPEQLLSEPPDQLAQRVASLEKRLRELEDTGGEADLIQSNDEQSG